MDFPPDHYFEAATERMRQARYVFNEGKSYALVIYVGGVAVECLLRAFKGLRGLPFDEKHNLLKLFDASGIIGFHADSLKLEKWSDDAIAAHRFALRVAVNDVIAIWSNTYRFASESRLRSHLKKKTRYEKIKGDYLKELAKRFLNSCQTFFDKGVILWPH